MVKLYSGFVSTFLNSVGVLDFHRVSMYAHSLANDFQKSTIKQK